MAVSLNSVVVLNPSTKYFHVPKSGTRASILNANHFAYPLGMVGLRRHKNSKKRGLCLLVANGDRIAIDAIDKGPANAETSDSDVRSSSLDSPVGNSQFQTSAETVSEDSNGSVVSSNQKQEATSVNTKSGVKRSSLTAREKLRAARVLSRYTESKASNKAPFGSKVLEALRESDKGKKKSRLPEAPTNMLDDSKRGMPKPGWTFEFPGGIDVFFIAVSFVLISTLMFATTYFVWKVGAIHFNE
ncbi:hypothetical protein RHGRI_027647 [Rhododendron griersonianum]|uniref:Uncharacterized protein n=1 Tax=Rhododendron griersonianum TaxID=479676 RepID=A0AAV6J010_9ERIC|nr:hypothetical protein RHGRI_027647 [Rhododendron griersonianum]